MKKDMRDYIKGTPNIILENLNDVKGLVFPLYEVYSKQDYKRIILVCSGSSYTASQAARLYMEDTLSVSVDVINPFTFTNYYAENIKEDEFVLIISQSGASSNCIDALKKLNSIGRQALILTADPNCEAKEYADFVFDWKCGIETVGFVTLGVVSLIVYLQLFSAYTIDQIENKGEKKYASEQITKAMTNHKLVCDLTDTFIVENYRGLMSMEKAYVLGCGSNYGTALEGALKMGETIKVPTVGYELDEFLHGPALQLTPKYHLFVTDSNDNASSYAKHVYENLQTISEHVYFIGSNEAAVHDKKTVFIPDGCDQPFTCLYNLPFYQLIACTISDDIGSGKSHPLYYEMNKSLDFRTRSFREDHGNED